MDRLSGLLVVLGGTVLGTYFGLPPSENGSGRQAQDIPHIAAPDGVRTSTGLTTIAKTQSPLSAEEGGHRIRIFSPSEPLLAAIYQKDAPPAAVEAPSPTWTTVITPGNSTAGKFSSPRPSDPATRSALAADLQRELQRVGCYGGEINGGWTTSTRHAMSAFMDRVNASLPIDDPDFILLTLVQNHRGLACGAGCPAGEVQAGSGRCVPETVLAHAAEPAQSEEEIRHAQLLKLRASRRAAVARAETVKPGASSPAQRTAASGTRADKRRIAAVEAPASENLPWNERLPWVEKQPAPATTASIATPSAADAYSGRMAVGGPVPDDVAKPRKSLTSETASRGVPSPKPATRPASPTRQAALQQQGLPGTKSGIAARPGLAGTKAGPAVQRPKKAVSKPRSPAAQRVLKKRKHRYASGFGGKGRRYQPRMGSAGYNVMMSLGGIY